MRLMLIATLGVLLAGPLQAQERASEETPTRVDASFGKGLNVASGDGRFTLQMRARAQLRYTATDLDTGDVVSNEFIVRRLRLSLRGTVFDPTIDYYIQLGFAAPDLETDLRVPVRDAYVGWSPLRDVNFRFGQMKVPYGVQLRVSSGALQFVDRSLVISELSLDRDTGLMMFSNDFLGLSSLLGYQLGVYGGDGRNRSYPDAGVLSVARLQFKPLGKFEELVEGGFDRRADPRLMIGVGAAYNAGTRRANSTFGAVFDHAKFNYTHFDADAVFKWRGVSLQGEWLYRKADRNEVMTVVNQKENVELSRSAWGGYGQVGYALTEHHEVVMRYGEVHPLDEAAANAKALTQKELGAGYNWYGQGHDFKIQSDLFRIGGHDLWADGQVRFRTQVQFWF